MNHARWSRWSRYALALALLAILCVGVCSCTSAPIATGEVSADGGVFVRCDGARLLGLSRGNGYASLTVLGEEWKRVEFLNGKVRVIQAKPRIDETYDIGLPLPTWVLPLFPEATVDASGAWSVTLPTGDTIRIRPKPMQP